MLKKIKNITLALALSLTMGLAFTAVPTGVSAAELGECKSIKGSLSQGINTATTGTDTTCNVGSADGPSSLQEIAQKVVNFLSVIVGVVAVIMIIVGGFKYITSGGDSGNVSGAKNTLIYAIVGLIIVALAQFIVNFVLNNI